MGFRHAPQLSPRWLRLGGDFGECFIGQLGHALFFVESDWIWPSMRTGLMCVLIGYTGSYRVLLGYNGFYWDLLGFTGFYHV